MPDNGTSSHAAGMLNQAGTTTRTRADQQVRSLAGTLSGVADDLGQMAEGGADPGGSLSGLARDGSRLARTVAERLDRDGLDGALQEVTSFARRRPVLFLAGAFAAGISLGRLTRNADLGGMAQAVKNAEPGGDSHNGQNGGSSTGGSTSGDPLRVVDRPEPDESHLTASRPAGATTGQGGGAELGAMGLRPEAAGEQHVTEDLPPGTIGRSRHPQGAMADDDPSVPRRGPFTGPTGPTSFGTEP